MKHGVEKYGLKNTGGGWRGKESPRGEAHTVSPSPLLSPVSPG